MAIDTAQKIITSSLKLLAVVDPGEAPGNDDLADGLDALNEMMQNWRTQRLTIYHTASEPTVCTGFATLSDFPSFIALGIPETLRWNLAQDLALQYGKELSPLIVARAAETKNALRNYTGHVAETPGTGREIIKGALRFSGVIRAGETLTDAEEAYGLDALNNMVELWQNQHLSLYDTTPALVTGFATFTTDPTFKTPGVQEALRANLAVELAPEYGLQEIPQHVIAKAIETKEALRNYTGHTPGTAGTARELIKGALRFDGILRSGETLTGSEETYCLAALNSLLQSWQAEGIGLWLNQKCTLILADDTAQYGLGTSGDRCSDTMTKTELSTAASVADGTIEVDSITGILDADIIGIELDSGTIQWNIVNGGPVGTTVTLTQIMTAAAAVDNHVYAYTDKIARPLEIVEARRVGSDDNETPLVIVSRDEYMALSDKTSTGPVNLVYYDPQQTTGQLYCWPVCDDVKVRVSMTVKRPFTTFASITSSHDLTDEWLDALKFNLAVNLAPEFGADVPPVVAAKAVETKELVKGFDRENVSLFIGPNYRG